MYFMESIGQNWNHKFFVISIERIFNVLFISGVTFFCFVAANSQYSCVDPSHWILEISGMQIALHDSILVSLKKRKKIKSSMI